MPSVVDVLQIGRAVVRERMSHAERSRTPEPMVMEGPEGTQAFHVAHPVLQAPTYRFCAESMSRLLPEGGRVLDLGSGSGRLVADLAAARRDVRVVGTDLSEEMLRTGRAFLREQGLEARVELRQLDMTRAADFDAPVDLVSSIWALHHLPAREDLVACLEGIADLRRRTGCGVWIFDFARLRRPDTFPAFLALAPDAPEQLRVDGVASERAAWTVEELSSALAEAGLSDLVGGRERMVGHYQCHYAPPAEAPPSGHQEHWRPELLPKVSEAIVRRMRRSLPRP